MTSEKTHDLVNEKDTKLLCAYTPQRYAGEYPEFFNITMVRLDGDVVLTVRLPTKAGHPPGSTSSVRFTRDMWKRFMEQIGKANEQYEACDFLDSIC